MAPSMPPCTAHGKCSPNPGLPSHSYLMYYSIFRTIHLPCVCAIPVVSLSNIPGSCGTPWMIQLYPPLAYTLEGGKCTLFNLEDSLSTTRTIFIFCTCIVLLWVSSVNYSSGFKAFPKLLSTEFGFWSFFFFRTHILPHLPLSHPNRPLSLLCLFPISFRWL